MQACIEFGATTSTPEPTLSTMIGTENASDSIEFVESSSCMH